MTMKIKKVKTIKKTKQIIINEIQKLFETKLRLIAKVY